MIEYTLNKLDYNPDTGIFIWKEKVASTVPKGTVAGCKDHEGYIIIRHRGKNYKAHRLAWQIVTGKSPTGLIDHINGVKNDNRFSNLREVDNRENQSNQHIHRSGKLIGACLDKRYNLWISNIQINKKKKYLGAFKTEIEAHNAYLTAKNTVRTK